MSVSPAFLIDLDGVIWHGDRAIPEALPFLRAIRRHPLLFLTNNSSQTPAAIHARLLSCGVDWFDPSQILTSAMATADCLRLETPDYRYYAVGGAGLHESLSHSGRYDPVDPDYVVVGEGPGLDYATLSIGVGILHRGRAQLIGTNPDANVDAVIDGKPTILPGGGALVSPFEVASGKPPRFIGKPFPAMFGRALEQLGRDADQVVMVGDRPDTDIRGAAQAGLRTILVRTGRFDPGQVYPEYLPTPDRDVESLAQIDPADLTFFHV
jgi:NagD protein